MCLRVCCLPRARACTPRLAQRGGGAAVSLFGGAGTGAGGGRGGHGGKASAHSLGEAPLSMPVGCAWAQQRSPTKPLTTHPPTPQVITGCVAHAHARQAGSTRKKCTALYRSSVRPHPPPPPGPRAARPPCRPPPTCRLRVASMALTELRSRLTSSSRVLFWPEAASRSSATWASCGA